MDFTEYSCDGCGKRFTKDDNIVTCPECGTPQHRECWDALGGCVNGAKHVLGYEWSPNKTVAEKTEDGETKMIFEDDEPVFARAESAGQAVQRSLNNNELPDVDDVIQQRIDAICPGITEEQKAEQVCGADVGLTASFVGNGAGRYIDKFRRIEKSNAHTFNWAAFLFSPFWFFWRKQYKAGIVFATLSICESLLVYYVSSLISPLYSILDQVKAEGVASLTQAQITELAHAEIPFYAIMFAMLVIALIIGFTADRMYHRYITKTIVQFKEVKQQDVDGEMSLRFYLSKSSTSVMFTMLAILAVEFIPNIILSIMGN